MKKNIIKLNFELFGLQLFFAVLSFFITPFFAWIKAWKLVCGIFVGWLFLGAVHSTFWQKGNKDKKNNVIQNNHLENGQEKIKLNLLNGAVYALPFLIVNLLLLLLTYITFDNSSSGNIIYLIHRVFLLSLAGFIPEASSVWYWPVCILLCFIMYLPCVTAYISGTYNFSLTEKYVPKIIYKSVNKENKDK